MPFDNQEQVHRSPLVEVLDIVLSILGEDGEGWLQQRSHNETNTRFCATGAIFEAARRYAITHPTNPAIWDLERLGRMALCGVIGTADIAGWNDHPSRSFYTVRNSVLAARSIAAKQMAATA